MPEVLGIGAPVIDYIIEVSEDFLDRFKGKKAGMEVVDYQTIEEMIKKSEVIPEVFLGGSGANTIRGLANFGHACGFIGRIGKDSAGRKFSEGMKSLGIETQFLLPSTTPTAQVVCLITPDKERTMRAFLGASRELKLEDLEPRMFEGVNLVHLEGYNLLKPGFTRRAMEMAREAGAKVSFDLGSFEVVESNVKMIRELLSRYISIVFANQQESYALTQVNPEHSCRLLKDLCEVAVILLGKEGCLVGKGNTLIASPAVCVPTPVDTTGAGDLFASGFLHGYLQGNTLEECAHFGALTGAAVIQVHGVEIPPPDWIALKEKVKQVTL